MSCPRLAVWEINGIPGAAWLSGSYDRGGPVSAAENQPGGVRASWSYCV